MRDQEHHAGFEDGSGQYVAAVAYVVREALEHCKNSKAPNKGSRFLNDVTKKLGIEKVSGWPYSAQRQLIADFAETFGFTDPQPTSADRKAASDFASTV